MNGGLRQRNTRTAAALFVVFAAMIGLTAASVPLYRLFCSVTGYQGTTQVALKESHITLDSIVTVRFNAEVGSDMPWTFVAPKSVRLKIGETGLAFFKVRNNSAQKVTGRAVYNVTPDEAGLYFNKIACFCFSSQTLDAGQEAEMPVSFFVDPKIVQDLDAKDVHTITLSYTFYPALDAKPAPIREQADAAPARGDSLN